MEYQIRFYSSEKEFDDDAAARYGQVIRLRSVTSYDRFWQVVSIAPVDKVGFYVVWGRVAPLRKH